jgi:hypothetical protein
MEYFTKLGTSIELNSNSYKNRNSNVKVSNLDIGNLIKIK